MFIQGCYICMDDLIYFYIGFCQWKWITFKVQFILYALPKLRVIDRCFPLLFLSNDAIKQSLRSQSFTIMTVTSIEINIPFVMANHLPKSSLARYIKRPINSHNYMSMTDYHLLYKQMWHNIPPTLYMIYYCRGWEEVDFK